jgi:hypothetical protein
MDKDIKYLIWFTIIIFGMLFVFGMIQLHNSDNKKVVYGSNTWCMAQVGTILINGHTMPISDNNNYNITITDCCCISGNEFFCICPDKENEINYLIRSTK